MKTHGCRQASVRHRDFRKYDHVAAAIILAVRFGEAKVEPPHWKIFQKPGEDFFTMLYHRGMWLWGNKVFLNSDGKSRRKPSQPGRYERTQSRGFATAMKRMILTQVKNADGVMRLSRKVSATIAAAGGQAYCAVCLLCIYDFTVCNKYSGMINTNCYELLSPLIHGIRASGPVSQTII